MYTKVILMSVFLWEIFVYGENPADPIMPVHIIINKMKCATGILLTRNWVLSGNWKSCAPKRPKLREIRLQLSDQTRDAVGIQEYDGILNKSDPIFPDLKIVLSNLSFNLKDDPFPINVGLLSAQCEIVYYPQDKMERKNEKNGLEGNPEVRTFEVSVFHHITCSSEYKIDLYDNVVCVYPHSDVENTPKGSALFCLNALYGFKFKSLFLAEDTKPTTELYFGLGKYADWLKKKVHGIRIMDEISIGGDYEESKSLGKAAWLEFNESIGNTINEKFHILIAFVFVLGAL